LKPGFLLSFESEITSFQQQLDYFGFINVLSSCAVTLQAAVIWARMGKNATLFFFLENKGSLYEYFTARLPTIIYRDYMLCGF
jgi:hypothetical protein